MADDTLNQISEQQGLEIFRGAAQRREKPSRPAAIYKEAAREIPVYGETDVLVIGGGPAGTAASIAAARCGAQVMLIERYNHLGGLSTGGLVIWIDRMTDWNGKQVIAGFAREIFERLPREAWQGPPQKLWGAKDAASAAYWAQRTAAYHGTVTWSPTLDPEALKTLSLQMVLEQKVRLTLHAYAVAPIVKGGALAGAVMESKEGRAAVFAKVVIDTTGDADLIARAGLSCASDIDDQDIHHCMNTAFLLGGVDMERWIDFRTGDPDGFAAFMARGRAALGFFEKPFVSWRNDVALFMGPRLSGYSAIDVDDLTAVEIRSRELTVGHLDIYRQHAPGFAQAFLMLGAPQVGVRHSRRMQGLGAVTRADWVGGKVFDDEIGVSTSLAPKFPNVSVPYASLIPAGIDGLLAAGRHMSSDANSHTFLREIPQCWMTGQAAGVAAALAADRGLAPRIVDVREVQRALLKQGVYLSPQVEAKVGGVSEAAE